MGPKRKPAAGGNRSAGLDSGGHEENTLADARPQRNLRPGHSLCLCRACGVFFRSVRAFDRHREGPAAQRRCCATPRMPDKGLHPDPRGFWRLPLREYAGPRLHRVAP